MNQGKFAFVRLRLPAVLALLLLSLVGCTHLRQAVTPLANRQVAALDADAIVQMMQRAGFSDEQILGLGTDLRNSLAAHGAAQIRVRDKTEAIFAVHAPYIHVSSRQRGTFIYDVEKGEIR